MTGFADSRVSISGIGSVVGKIMSDPSGNSALAEVGGVETVVRIVAGVTINAGDTVLMIKYSTVWFVFAVIAAAPPAPPPPASVPPPKPPGDPAPPTKPPVRTGTLICAPVTTATYRDGKWRTDVAGGTSGGELLQGIYSGYGSNTGCAFYGTKPRSLKGSTVTRATLRMYRVRSGDFAAKRPTLRLLTQATRPAGAATLNESVAGPSLAVGASTTSFVLPNSWAQAIVNGSRGGIGMYTASGSPYMRFAGRSSWSSAFVMTISWRK